ncbi:GNAT family N-acetyltransferase [Orpheovirus IHUMI-LCC2]|uniref:GNAT family N-acetyltransferase n=1 Tax=Orpheovirus IHUMI-LCC2 TaxID=2023057 RepID=A0A2I2L3Y6_9VIRU|nr:GNAT family N-acetyltransferase [Orpheovirus IHUMI-LCC2]SNW62230.1 GNAT family N-acetyltransferase [Orpheovirus IHUMI-LCC2]
MVHRIFVGEKYRGMGYATNYINTMKSFGVDICLEVYVDNIAAVKLYEKLLFNIIDMHYDPELNKNYYIMKFINK